LNAPARARDFVADEPKPSATIGGITGVLNTGATGTGALRRIEFQFRAEF
jgi:hypothetical protein